MIFQEISPAQATNQTNMDSPCVKICIINPQTRLCDGCARTIEEIASWSSYSREERQIILNKLEDRKKALRKE